MRSLSWSCCAVALAHRHHRPTAPAAAAAWTWSLSDNNGHAAAAGPRVSGGACETVAAPAGADGAAGAQRTFLFGGQPLGPPDDGGGALAVTGGAGASVASSAASRRSTLAEARAEAAAAALARADAEGAAVGVECPPYDGPATHDLWVYERDRADGGEEWARIPRRVQGVSRPSPRTHAATAVLGHLLFLFGGYDPATKEALSDVWVLSTKTLKWSRSQAWLPYPAWGHQAAAVSDTTIALHTHRGVLLYDDDAPTPDVVEQSTTGQGPDGLRLCAGCGIAREGGEDGAGQDLLVFGGAAGDRLSAAAYVLDTQTWAWTELNAPPGADRPPPLRAPSAAAIGDRQCLAFGGAARGEDGAGLVATDAAWLLTVRDGAAAWERLARPAGPGPSGREAAALGTAGPGALVLRGGRDPARGTDAGDDGGTWLLTERPVDPRAAAARREARQKAEDAEGAAADGATAEAAARVADVIARAGGARGFDGAALGVGGLEDVLDEVRRRIWTPLAAPPKLLTELGIQPTRGLLLYGAPGCGKTLLASTLGNMMSPFRPITVVNGPEILDKFVGSSEANLRQIFDSPPDIYEECRRNETDGGAALSRAAVHIVVMDEFDAVARARGGGGGGQGDAGVARDSVVNQLLAKMDGVQPLAVPTLVIGLTNKRSLIEPALLRPGRFEVQIEITPPKTVAQRRSIMAVHTKQMVEAGRLQVKDPPPGSAAARQLPKSTHNADVLTYDQLTNKLAIDCDGFSGAAIAGVARAAASRALARAVGRLSGDAEHLAEDDEEAPSSMMDCLVTQDDFYRAVHDIRDSMGTGDQAEAEVVDDEIDRRRVGFRSRLRHRLRTWILTE